jgi:hypothetical protein
MSTFEQIGLGTPDNLCNSQAHEFVAHTTGPAQDIAGELKSCVQ